MFNTLLYEGNIKLLMTHFQGTSDTINPRVANALSLTFPLILYKVHRQLWDRTTVFGMIQGKKTEIGWFCDRAI